MTLSAGSPEPIRDPAAPVDDPDGAPLAVAVGRSIGGILLILVGGAILAGIVFLLFVTPFLGGDWDLAETFSEFFWVPAAIGLGILLWGVTLVRRARKTRLEEEPPA